MKKGTYQVYNKNKQRIMKYSCEYHQLKKLVAKEVIEIPYDCLLLISSQNKEIYSSNQITSQNTDFFTCDIREIFYDKSNLEYENKLLKSQIYDLNQQNQKYQENIQRLDINLKELQIQNQFLNQEKQKNENNFKILINEKIEQIQVINNEKEGIKRKYENEIQQDKQREYLIQQELVNEKLQYQQESQSLQEKHRNVTQQLQEELAKSQQELAKTEQKLAKTQEELAKKKQELKDFEFAQQIQMKTIPADEFIQKIRIMKLENDLQKLVFENCQLNTENKELQKKIKELSQKS